MSGRIEGRVAIVTGGARGIGEGVVRRLVAEGARVVIADIREELGAAVAADLGEAARFVTADVTQQDAWDRLLAAAEAFGGLDILVNNAGGVPGLRTLMESDLDYHRTVMDLNVTSTWMGMRTAIPALRARGGGSIVNISSIDGLSGMGRLSSYSAAKFAVTGITRSVALEVGVHNIRVNSVHPGYIGTPVMLAAPPERLKYYHDAVKPLPIARLGTPADIAGAVLFFASDDSSYCTGTSLVVDGGHLAGTPFASDN